MKFYWVLFFIFLFTCNQVDNQNQEQFQEWKVGNFHYSEGSFKYLIHRTTDYQEEFLLQDGLLVRFKINWENDSVYTMKFDSILSNPNQTQLAFDITQIQKKCTMTNVTAHSYIERSENNLNDLVGLTRIIKNTRD